VDGLRSPLATEFRAEKVEVSTSNTRKEKGVRQEVVSRRRWLDAVEIGAVDGSEIEEALDVAARGLGDNPLTVAAFGEDPDQRRRSFRRFVCGAAKALGWGPNMLVARGPDGQIVGVCNALPPGECPASPSRQLRMLSPLLSSGPHAAERTMCWLGLWTRRDSKGRHWHVGPLAVDAHLQGMGVGSLLMQVFCARMYAACEDAYLETDEETNVLFYERFGFEVVGEEQVLSVTNRFLLRRPEGRHA
jgi:ribosomal protein S18 acetylase RimI-like enzyme